MFDNQYVQHTRICFSVSLTVSLPLLHFVLLLFECTKSEVHVGSGQRTRGAVQLIDFMIIYIHTYSTARGTTQCYSPPYQVVVGCAGQSRKTRIAEPMPYRHARRCSLRLSRGGSGHSSAEVALAVTCGGSSACPSRVFGTASFTRGTAYVVGYRTVRPPSRMVFHAHTNSVQRPLCMVA